MKSAKTQSDTNMNFDGMEKIAPKHSTKYLVNQHTGYMNDGRLVNKGRGPTGGNTKVPSSSGGKGSAQVRTPGGTRAFDPSATQNYKGNADKINVGRGPTKGNK